MSEPTIYFKKQSKLYIKKKKNRNGFTAENNLLSFMEGTEHTLH